MVCLCRCRRALGRRHIVRRENSGSRSMVAWPRGRSFDAGSAAADHGTRKARAVGLLVRHRAHPGVGHHFPLSLHIERGNRLDRACSVAGRATRLVGGTRFTAGCPGPGRGGSCEVLVGASPRTRPGTADSRGDVTASCGCVPAPALAGASGHCARLVVLGP